MSMSKPVECRNRSFEENYRNFHLAYRPFQHEDGTFSSSVWIYRGKYLVLGYLWTSVDDSLPTLADAVESRRQSARKKVDVHLELWASDSR